MGFTGGGDGAAVGGGRSGVAERPAHQDEGEHLEQAVLDAALQLRDVRGEVAQRRRQRRTATAGDGRVTGARTGRQGRGWGDRGVDAQGGGRGEGTGVHRDVRGEVARRRRLFRTATRGKEG